MERCANYSKMAEGSVNYLGNMLAASELIKKSQPGEFTCYLQGMQVDRYVDMINEFNSGSTNIYLDETDNNHVLVDTGRELYRFKIKDCSLMSGVYTVYCWLSQDVAGKSELCIELKGVDLTASDKKFPTYFEVGDAVSLELASSNQVSEQWMNEVVRGKDIVLPNGMPKYAKEVKLSLTSPSTGSVDLIFCVRGVAPFSGGYRIKGFIYAESIQLDLLVKKV